MKKKNEQFIVEVIVSLCMLFFVMSCETSFEPLQENNLYTFSMYGTLDVHADTQWVRVMPISDTLIPENPEPTDTEVMLTRESTGENIVLRDSLFRFGGDTYVWNYWTTTSLHPNEVYTVTASMPDGSESHATVTVPSSLQLPKINYSTESETGSVKGTVKDQLVVAESRYVVQVITEVGLGPEWEVVLSHLDEVYMEPNGEFSLTLDSTRLLLARELNVTVSEIVVNKREFIIITGSEDWPDLSDLSEEEMVLPDVVSNVENGTGLISGIAKRKVPLISN